MINKFLLLILIFSSGLSVAFSDEIQTNLEWSIETSKKEYYPGEPLVMILKVKNTGPQEVGIGFRGQFPGAFSIEIRDSNDSFISKGKGVQRAGMSKVSEFLSDLNVTDPDNFGQMSVVLNRWCSTLLPPGQYKVFCIVQYSLNTEPIPGLEHVYLPTSSQQVHFELYIRIVETNKEKFIELIKEVANKVNEISKPKTYIESMQRTDEKELAKEMLSFTESEFAVPYQLRLLRLRLGAYMSWDIANTLAKSGTLEAAKGLIEIVEEVDKPEILYANKKTFIWIITDAVYKLRETQKPDILEATNNFAEKYKPAGRPYFEID